MLRSRFRITSGAVALTALAMLAGCSSNTTISSAPESSATHSSLASQPSSSSPASQTATTEAFEQESSSDEQNPIPENFQGSAELKNAESVQATDSKVQDLSGLLDQAQQVTQEAQLLAVPSAVESQESAESPTDTGSSRGSDLQLSPDSVQALEKVSVGSALDQYISSATEYAQNGWTVEGKSTIVGTAKVASTSVSGQDAQLIEVCLDSSGVTVKDSAGNPLSADQRPTRSLTVFTLIQSDNAWKIASVDFPNEADC